MASPARRAANLARTLDTNSKVIAEQVAFDDSTADLDATNMQAATEKVDERLDGAGAATAAENVSFAPTGTSLEATTLQDAIAELDDDRIALAAALAAAIVDLEGQIDAVIATAVGETNTAANVGSGTGQVYKAKSGVELQFRRIAAGQGIAISNGTNDITIRSVYVTGSDPGAVGAGVLWVNP